LKQLLEFLGVRQREAVTVLLMTSYFFLAMTCTSIIKSLQSSLYLAKLGFDWRLPLLYVGIAALSGPVVLAYRFLTRSGKRLRLGLATLAFFLISLFFFYILVRSGDPWIYPLFYTWGGVFTVLLPIQGWVTCYDLYGTREAKRLFAIMGGGGILGGAFGGFYTAGLAQDQGNEILLLHTCVFLALSVVLLSVVQTRNKSTLVAASRTYDRFEQKQDGAFKSLRQILRSKHLRYLATVVFITGVSTTLIDLLYKWSLANRYVGSERDIAQFFGSLLGAMFIFSAPLQLFGTGRLIRRFGVGVGLLILPICLMLGSIGTGIIAAFWTVVLLKAIDGGLRNSLDRTSIELLYIPLVGPVMASVKSFVDLGVFRAGDAFGATLFLLMAFSVATPIRPTAFLIFLGTIVWTLLAWKLGKEYVQTLRSSLERRTLASSRASFHLEEAVAERTLTNALESQTPSNVLFALEQLLAKETSNGQRQWADFPTSLEDLSQSQITALYPTDHPPWLEKVKRLVDHSDPEIAATAMHLATRFDPKLYIRQMKAELRSPSPPPEKYLIYLDRYGRRVASYLTPQRIVEWQQQIEQKRAVLLARLMAKTSSPSYLPILDEWLNHPDPVRINASIRAIGDFRSEQHIERLIKFLDEPRTRRAARNALGSYGDSIVPMLQSLLKDPSVSLSVKREIPLILRSINAPQAREALVAALYLPDTMVAFRALKGLNKIRAEVGLNYPEESFLPAVQIWVKQYYELLHLSIYLEAHGGLACRLLGKAVEERIAWKVEKIFRALGLFIPQGDAYISYLGYTSDQARLRENAIELIDVHIKGELRKTLLPVFSADNRKEVAAKGRVIFNLPIEPHILIADVVHEGDPWLKCCIIAAAATHDFEDLKEMVRRAQTDPNPLVRETAVWALQVWGNEKSREYRC